MPDITTLLADLGHHPGWMVLKDVAARRKEKHFRYLAARFVEQNKRPDYEMLQWYRGFFAGMEFLLDNPTIEARKLEKALARENEVNS